MHASEVIEFYRKVSTARQSRWSEPHLDALSQQRVPDDLLGPRAWLLRVDATLAHARWFLDSLCDTAAFEHDEGLGLAHLAERIRDAICAIDQHLPLDELTRIIEVLSTVTWQDIEEKRAERRRARITIGVKNDLWFECEPNQRCYLCGHRFTPAARDYFLGRSTKRPPVPLLVDFTRPRLKERHSLVEVDHVRPVAEGGSNAIDNLRLACGLCNIVKSRHSSLYDTHAWPLRSFRHPDLGWVTVPQPLWLLRVISLRGRCEHRDGCSATLETDELFAAPWSSAGSLNPVNIKIYCKKHDPWSTKRLVRPALIAAMPTTAR